MRKTILTAALSALIASGLAMPAMASTAQPAAQGAKPAAATQQGTGQAKKIHASAARKEMKQERTAKKLSASHEGTAASTSLAKETRAMERKAHAERKEHRHHKMKTAEKRAKHERSEGKNSRS
ncbi:MAG: hypothetical protein ACK4UL_07260 [Novosphingobium meiothermophilum]|nr:hypothetical protein [Novosphingobium meiothermophilum]